MKKRLLGYLAYSHRNITDGANEDKSVPKKKLAYYSDEDHKNIRSR